MTDFTAISTGTNHRGAFTLAYPGPPWQCYFCGWPILYTFENDPIREHYKDWLVVHHHDEDRSNNQLNNLRPAHLRCHTSYHVKKRVPEERRWMAS